MTGFQVVLCRLDDAITRSRTAEAALRDQGASERNLHAASALNSAADMKRAERHGLEQARRLVHTEHDLQATS